MANASIRLPISRPISKAVIPVAGLGTRFLPATKAMPKEMLPVVDTPAIQYVVEEAAAAGLTDIMMITGRNKRAVEDHFDHAYELEAFLLAKGDLDRLELVQRSSELAALHYVRQGIPKGLGHAVLCARHHVGDEHVAVLLGDDLIDPRDALLTPMIELAQQTGGSVLALMEVSPEATELYGCAAVEPTDQDGVLRVTGLVEKPKPEDAPSRYALLGRYVLEPAVFDILERTEPGRHGEIQLTDALAELAAGAGKGPVHGIVFRGRRYDTGDRLEYLKSVVRLASEHAQLGADFRDFLAQFSAELSAEQGTS